MSRALFDLIETRPGGARRMRVTALWSRKAAEAFALSYRRSWGDRGCTYEVQPHTPGRCWDCTKVHASDACTRKGDE